MNCRAPKMILFWSSLNFALFLIRTPKDSSTSWILFWRITHFFKKLCQSDNFWLLFLRLRQPSTAVAWEVRERGLSGRHQEGLDRRTGVCRRSDDLSREVLQAAPRVRQTKAQGFLQGSGISVQLSFRYFSEIVIYSSEMVVPGLLVKADCT